MWPCRAACSKRGQAALGRDRRVDFFGIEVVRRAGRVAIVGGRALLGVGRRNLAGCEQLARRLHRRLNLAGGRLLALRHGGLEHLALPLGCRAIERALLLDVDRLGRDPRIGAAREQHRDRLRAVLRRRVDQRRLPPVRVLGIGVGAVVEEDLDDVGVAGGGGQMQRRHAGRGRAGADTGAGFHERLDDGRAARLAGEVQRCVLTDTRRRADVRAGVHEHLGHLDVTPFGGVMQGAHAVALRAADVGALLEQRAERLAIAFHRRVGDG